MLLSMEHVEVRIPDGERSPTPRDGEVVVFKENFYRGFRLPASEFFLSFLTFFGFQPHHLASNVVLQLAAFVVLCEGFVGTEPLLDLWRKLFFFKQQSVPTDKPGVKMTPCGAALVHHWLTSGFPKLPLQESVKKWQRGFFYVKNAIPEVKMICTHLDILKAQGLLARDLIATMVARRVPPLQSRPCLIYHMGGRRDPCWISTKNFQDNTVAQQVNLISSASKDEGGNWEWGMAPYDRDHPAPMMFKRLQAYRLLADVEVSDPIEIEDEGEVEPQPSASEDVEGVAESEGSELPGELLTSALLDWTDDDDASPPLHGVADGEDLEELEEVSSPPLARLRRAARELAVQR
ncbi:hypothetical protein D1007_53338 [Hordeum vulgare]|nr:hypothetical protein D1007_53338 [Hordeum vulgare]